MSDMGNAVANAAANIFSRLQLGFAAIVATLCVVSLSVLPAHAVEIDINKGNVDPLPIAITDFVGGEGQEAKIGADISSVISDNLERSGLFRPLPKASFIEKVSDINVQPRFGDWRIINSQALVTGQVRMESDGRLRVEFRLWDVLGEQQMTGLQFFTTPDNWRRVAHLISDAIYKRMTGEEGYFDTRIVYVSETGPKNARVKRLAIMDQDGHNPRMLTNGNELVLTPRFSPNSQEITYLAYRNNQPRVYVLDIETGQQEVRWPVPGHDLRAALLAGRAAHHHEPSARRQFRHLYDGSAQPPGDAPHQYGRDRYRAELFAGRPGDHVRIGPRRFAADLCHGRRRVEPAARQFRAGQLCDARLVAARRSDCPSPRSPAAGS